MNHTYITTYTLKNSWRKNGGGSPDGGAARDSLAEAV
jgi:hypothetical protein